MKRKILFLALSLVFIVALFCVTCSAYEYTFPDSTGEVFMTEISPANESGIVDVTGYYLITVQDTITWPYNTLSIFDEVLPADTVRYVLFSGKWYSFKECNYSGTGTNGQYTRYSFYDYDNKNPLKANISGEVTFLLSDYNELVNTSNSYLYGFWNNAVVTIKEVVYDPLVVQKYYQYSGHLSADYLKLLNDVPESVMAPYGNLHEKIGFDGVLKTSFITAGYLPFVKTHDPDYFRIGTSDDLIILTGKVEYGFIRLENSADPLCPDPIEWDIYIFEMHPSIDDGEGEEQGVLKFWLYSSTLDDYALILGNWTLSATGEYVFMWNEVYFSNSYLTMDEGFSLLDLNVYLYFACNEDSMGGMSVSWLLDGAKTLTPKDDIAAFTFDMLDEGDTEDSYNNGYDDGYKDGLEDNTAYNEGYLEAVRQIDEGEFGENFLSGIFSAPFAALSSFVIAKSPNGTVFTLGGILSMILIASLFFVFLRMFGR